jgi:hypothetical protein
MDAISTLPTPSVVALVGACRRIMSSGSLIRPIEPTNAKKPPATISRAITSSISKVIGSSGYSMMSPRSMKRQ